MKKMKEGALDAFDPAERRAALEAAAPPARRAGTGGNVNMHLHSFHSFNALGWSPSPRGPRSQAAGAVRGSALRLRRAGRHGGVPRRRTPPRPPRGRAPGDSRLRAGARRRRHQLSGGARGRLHDGRGFRARARPGLRRSRDAGGLPRSGPQAQRGAGGARERRAARDRRRLYPRRAAPDPRRQRHRAPHHPRLCTARRAGICGGRRPRGLLGRRALPRRCPCPRASGRRPGAGGAGALAPGQARRPRLRGAHRAHLPARRRLRALGGRLRRDPHVRLSRRRQRRREGSAAPAGVHGGQGRGCGRTSSPTATGTSSRARQTSRQSSRSSWRRPTGWACR